MPEGNFEAKKALTPTQPLVHWFGVFLLFCAMLTVGVWGYQWAMESAVPNRATNPWLKRRMGLSNIGILNPIDVLKRDLLWNLWRSADSKYWKGDFEGAARSWLAAAVVEGDDPYAKNNMAWSLVRAQKNLDFAISQARKAVQLAPNDAACLDTLGWALFFKKNYAEAERYLKLALRFNPNQGHSWYMLGRVYEENNKPASAIKCYQRAIKAYFQGEEEFRRDALKRLQKLTSKERD